MHAGKLLTTPSRLLKLVIPLHALAKTSQSGLAPLALLVHPQQPLSYLERLIQSELPSFQARDGDERMPKVWFKAEESGQDAIEPRKPGERKDTSPEDMHDDAEDGLDTEVLDGKTQKTGKLQAPAEIDQEAENIEHERGNEFVRWSSSTEIGDFIRDAARGKEFAVEIEGAREEIRIGVPSFNDRTHYLRQRLRRTAIKIIELATVKKECDTAAHKSAQRVALGGAGLLVAYWVAVYRLTFETDLGWGKFLRVRYQVLMADVMEPVTYLVGLSTLIAGYLWFLYHNREVSYRAALQLTVSRRQTKLYESKGFDVQRWEALIEEANAYRKEIKQIASEYDVDWDEREDEKDDRVTDAMRQERRQRAKKDDQRQEDKEKDDDR